MTLALSDVETVWENLFEHEDILAITDKILAYQYTEGSQSEVEGLYKENSEGIGELNFFEYIVEFFQEQVIEVGGQQSPERGVQVEVRYTKQLTPNSNTESEVKAAIETVLDTVRSGLGSDWGINIRTDSTIAISAVAREPVNEVPCVRQIATFRAYKQ